MNYLHVIIPTALLALVIAAATTLAALGVVSGDQAFGLCRDVALTVIGGGAVAVGGNITKPPTSS